MVVQITQVVQVWGTHVEITIHQKSKTVWIASGQYLGVSYTAQGSSPTTAANAWREQARYATN